MSNKMLFAESHLLAHASLSKLTRPMCWR